jgi:hypothetical protein
MRKILFSALAAASILTTATAANAGYWWNGIYYPTCYWTAWGQYYCS